MARIVTCIARRIACSILLTFVIFCQLPASAAQTPDNGLWKYTFGTATSVTRAGFTKVTAEDAFTPDKGYGFQSTQGLSGLDRGGSEIKLPADTYTASVYGAYRTTSDLTAALVEGKSDNAFLTAVPDGDYTVWLVACDADWDPPLFQIWADGKKRLDVRIPRARFVFMEPFHAHAAAGRLRVEFKGAHGWIVSGLVIGKEGAELTDTIAKLERDIFFLTDSELPNWKETRPAPANPPLKWTTSEQQKGYVVFPADYTELIVPTYEPARAAIGRPLTTFATPGEFEPATFCLSTRKDLGAVSVTLSDFAGDSPGRTIASKNVKLGTVRCWPQRNSSWGVKGDYTVVPMMIETPDARSTQAFVGQVKQWWLTLHVPPDALAGRYRMKLILRPEHAPPTVVEWRLLVLPFHLVSPEDRHWGTWFEGFPPLGRLQGPAERGRNTPSETDRLARADMTDYHAHGFDLMLAGCYPDVKETQSGGFEYDLGALPQIMNYFKTLHSDAPIVVLFEYACRDLEYRFAEPGKAHVAGTFSPRAHQAILGLVRYLHNAAQQNHWPNLLYFPIDEPGNNKTENRMRFAENVLDFVHEVPGCKTATTVSASDLQRLGERVDVRIYSFGSYNPAKAIQDARHGHPFWYYNNSMFYSRSTLASRGYAGFEFLRSGAEVATAWGFDATESNPYNDFDGGHKDWNVLFPGVDSPTPTIYWELCREGVDDCRYAATLQQQIRLAKKYGDVAAAQRAGAVLAPILDRDAPDIENPLAFTRYRWRIAREILNLMHRPEGSLPFAAVARNASVHGSVGPNLISDPSFEAGPQEDGFLTTGYAIADRYSQQGAKPVDALLVTKEAAHSGHYSLKWDFSKAAGKGFLYEGKRYLIVNVQIPGEVAKTLRGKRVRVGYWFRLGGGAAVSGLTLRETGKTGYLGGISYAGGVDDPAVWNHFEAEDRLRDDFDSLDIHISCVVPDDAQAVAKSFFYIDDVSLQAIEEPLVTVSTPLDEYYVGETLPWTIAAPNVMGQIKVTLSAGGRGIAQQTSHVAAGSLQGRFETGGFKPGIYSVRASVSALGQTRYTAERQIILTPDPFAWKSHH